MPVIYHCLSYYGGDPVASPILALSKDFDPDETQVLQEVQDVYGHFDNVTLSGMTGVRDGPWHRTWRRYRRPALIPDNLIRDYHRQALDKAEDAGV